MNSENVSKSYVSYNFQDIYLQYQIHDDIQTICRRYMNVSFNLSVTSLTAGGAHRDIKVLRLLQKGNLYFDGRFNNIIDLFKENIIEEVFQDELR